MTAPLDATRAAGGARSADPVAATGPSDAFAAALAAATHGRASLGAPTQGARDRAVADRRPDHTRHGDQQPEQERRFPVRDRRVRDDRPRTRTPDTDAVTAAAAVHQQRDAMVRRADTDRRAETHDRADRPVGDRAAASVREPARPATAAERGPGAEPGDRGDAAPAGTSRPAGFAEPAGAGHPDVARTGGDAGRRPANPAANPAAGARPTGSGTLEAMLVAAAARPGITTVAGPVDATGAPVPVPPTITGPAGTAVGSVGTQGVFPGAPRTGGPIGASSAAQAGSPASAGPPADLGAWTGNPLPGAGLTIPGAAADDRAPATTDRTAAPATTGHATTGQSTTGQSTTGQSTTGQSTTGQATTGQATTGQATTAQAAAGQATAAQAAAGLMAGPDPAATGQPVAVTPVEQQVTAVAGRHPAPAGGTLLSQAAHLVEATRPAQVPLATQVDQAPQAARATLAAHRLIGATPDAGAPDAVAGDGAVPAVPLHVQATARAVSDADTRPEPRVGAQPGAQTGTQVGAQAGAQVGAQVGTAATGTVGAAGVPPPLPQPGPVPPGTAPPTAAPPAAAPAAAQAAVQAAQAAQAAVQVAAVQTGTTAPVDAEAGTGARGAGADQPAAVTNPGLPQFAAQQAAQSALAGDAQGRGTPDRGRPPGAGTRGEQGQDQVQAVGVPPQQPQLATAVATSAPANQAPATAQPPVATQVAMVLTPLRKGPDGVHRMTIQLSPGDLGPVSIVAEVRDGAIAVQLAAGSEAARVALQAALPDLRQDLRDGGFAQCTLDLHQNSQPDTGRPGNQSQQFSGWQSQGRSQQQAPEPRADAEVREPDGSAALVDVRI
ncbi:flagellar hook-length control protein FliK [Dactylosporangium siamense]|uniref:flagellar hook-length control protein FliK n=1 Tax=Dactylosporangium siamense TaxID=685454 RepID=UPI002FE987FE